MSLERVELPARDLDLDLEAASVEEALERVLADVPRHLHYEPALPGRGEATLRRVCEIIDLPFDDAMLEPPEREAIVAELGPVGGWRERLTAEQLAAFEDAAAAELDELGYREPVAAGTPD